MKSFIAAALALTVVGAAPAKTDPRTAAAFRAAFGTSGSAVLKRQGEYKETVKYTPGDLVETPFGPVLISPGEVLDAAHVNSGKLAAIYLKRTPRGFAVVKRFVPATETGSFGVIMGWRAHRNFGRLPIVAVDGGGTWQGSSCSWATLIELGPDKLRELVDIPLHYDNGGALEAGKESTTIDGTIGHVVSGRGFDVVYSGSKRFTERYVRREDRYVQTEGESQMETR